MQFYEITKDNPPHPGEYILYSPDNSIVVCGAFMGNKIKVLYNGKIIVDKVENFKKIKIPAKERKKKLVSRCKACGK